MRLSTMLATDPAKRASFEALRDAVPARMTQLHTGDRAPVTHTHLTREGVLRVTRASDTRNNA